LKYSGYEKYSTSGFTLIEIILTLVVASILGTILVQVMGTNYSGSAQNLLSRRDGFEVRKQLESITKDYRMWLENFPNQSIIDFKTGYVDTYSGSLNVSGVLNEIDSGNDGNIGILNVTVSNSDNSKSLTTFFTK
jgi:prepilin-type N-terminal cleavage/methylation domain-containing protein